MDCFFPGRVLVGPGPESEGAPFLAEVLRGEFGSDFEYEFGVDDVIRRNELDPHKFRKARTLPFVGRVPEGAEAEIAARISQFSRMQVGAASPDYLIRPAASISINSVALAKAIQSIRAKPGSSQCGKGCSVGILDSGIDPSLVPRAILHPKQYDALSPTAATVSPTDAAGHGTLVARIVSEVAPGATLISVRAFAQTGTISSIIAALYLAEAAGPCDVLNLSFSISCSPVPCAVCQTPAQASMNIGQLSYFFQTFMASATDTVLVAASGNNVQHLTLPAGFDSVIAVGSFDYDASLPISTYHQVPTNRFVLAPGGRGTAGVAYAQRAGFAKPEYLHGTSFAAAFVSAFAAKVACARKGGCGSPLMGHTIGSQSTIYSVLLAEIAARSDTSWTGYDPMKHGLGAILF